MNIDRWNGLFLAVCCIGCFSGCHRWRTHHKKIHENTAKQIIPPALNKQQMKHYELTIKGIECKQCIISILQDLHDSGMVDHVECLCKKNDYAHAKIMCYLDQQKKLELKKIKEVIEQETFVLKNITGTFVGDLVQKDDNFFFQISEFPAPFMFTTKDTAVGVKPAQSTVLTGTLWFDKKKFEPINQRH